MVSDDPDCKIELKTFHCEIVINHDALKKEENHYKDIAIIRKIDTAMVQRNYLQVKQDVLEIMQSEMERLLGDPSLTYLMLKK
ncbi:hypothetical protein FLSI110296_06280 [Flavobacterium sinopsychrotolerans]|uniref:hypothetical protein n=1 Tax=Flavobacterium sinopsychrotolerans TaxID=604089 RepID=UPI000B0F2EA8|nr:hypothetical protein [Flavobacterium sinopsychrotolerans]